MAYASLERFRDITGRNVLALQQAKEAGKKVVGQYCIYSPLEIALAAGAIPVSLCGTKNDSIPVAETMLPRSLCPLIKEQFRFRAPRQLSLSRRLGHRGGGHHLRRQEKDVRTAGRLPAGAYCSSFRRFRTGTPRTTGAPSTPSSPRGWKRISAFPSPRTICGMPSG